MTKAARNAVHLVLGCEWKVFFFHYTQCIWRKVQQKGLQIDYKERDDIRPFDRCAAVLPLIPPNQVCICFVYFLLLSILFTSLCLFLICLLLPDIRFQVEEVWVETLGQLPADDRCTAVADYVTTYWVEGALDKQQWNHYGNTGPRTNNHLEDWHHKLQQLVGKAHPTLFMFLGFLQKEQHQNETLLMQYAAGGK